MGFNTTVVVMNDALHAIENDPDFGKKLGDAIRSLGGPHKFHADVSALNHVNAATAIETHHADDFVVVAVGGNMGSVLGYGGAYRNTDHEIVKTLAAHLGYELRKKPSRKKR